MKRFWISITLIGLCVAAAAVFLFSCVVVDETEFVVVTEFGRKAALYGPGESGLHFHKPWSSTIRIDRRLHVFDPPAREVITGDKRNIEAACYVAWRVADPDVFLRSAGTRESAEARLSERVSAALSDAIAKRELDAIVSVDPSRGRLDEIGREVLESVRPRAAKELGVELVDVEPTSLAPPLEVRPSVFELIKSERKRVAQTLRAEGEAKYRTIVSEADRQRDLILSEAEAEAAKIRASAEADSARILNEAHAQDPRFYEFLSNLESYAALLDDQTSVVISASSPLLKLFTQGPGGELLKENPPANPTPPRGPIASPAGRMGSSTPKASQASPKEPKR